MVEHSAVNRVVVGSSPTRGVTFDRKFWLHGQAVKTSPFHGGNTGSIPVGVTSFIACYKQLSKPKKDQLEGKTAGRDMPMWLNWQSS